MNKNFIALAVAGLVFAAPAVVSAQAVSASLSASLNGGDVTFDADNTGAGVDVFAPTSISVSAAAGVMAVSSGASTGVSSATSAGASDDVDFTPTADIAFNGTTNAYETSIAFQEVITEEEIQAQIDMSIAEFCNGLEAELGDDAQTAPIFFIPRDVTGSVEFTNCAEVD